MLKAQAKFERTLEKSFPVMKVMKYFVLVTLGMLFIYILATFAPGVAREFYYLRKHQSFPTPGMLLHIVYPIFIKNIVDILKSRTFDIGN